MNIFELLKGSKGKTEEKHYLSAREIRENAKANAREMKRLEKKKYRKAEESEFTTVMKDNRNILYAFLGTQCFNIVVTFLVAWLMFGVVKPALGW